MLIRPKQKHKDKIFYNNLLLICAIAAIIFFCNAMSLCGDKAIHTYEPNYLNENTTFGPIVVDTNPKIFKVNAYFDGNMSSSYLTTEVQDEDGETLYELGKDFWHEEGYDSEGYWSESDRYLSAYLTFKDKGTYQLQFSTEEGNINNISISIKEIKKSYVPFYMFGSLLLLLVMIIFYMLNVQWVNEKAAIINEKLEEMSDD